MVMLAMVKNFIFDFRVRECHLRAVIKVVNIFFKCPFYSLDNGLYVGKNSARVQNIT